MEGGGDRKRKSGPLELNWDKLWGDDEPPQEVFIQDAKPEKSKASVGVMAENDDVEPGIDPCYRELKDNVLAEKIERAQRMITRLPLSDGGEKLRANLKKLQAEQERRMRDAADKCKMANPADDKPTGKGVTDDLSARKDPPSAPPSDFARAFSSRLNDGKATKCFGEELSTLNRCGHNNMRERVSFSAPRPQRREISSRPSSFKSPRHLSVDIDNAPQSNGQQLADHYSQLLPDQSDKNGPSCSMKKGSAARCESPHNFRRNNLRSRCRSPPNTRRNKRTFVLVDEEELEVEVVDSEDQVLRSCKGTCVYYPSRDDPDSIEISYSDLECLAPESYVSSPIINFYVRHLQKITSLKTTRGCDYHFFNTFFYKKLEQDVLTKADGENSFLKFRRWWKGVNIFEKSYIFLPIHDNLHWSLVIICIPNKEDNSGPIILHLDSLRMHCSKSIFSNVKRFLIEEWKFLKEEEVLPALPIADHIWDNLSRRIVEKVIEVPQQKNDYDCGLFVLYFMERFLEEVPERLSKSHLEMFGRRWFKPEEASTLRTTIHKLLIHEFSKENEADILDDSSE